MTTPTFDTKNETSVLNQIHDGMEVCDRDGKLIGKVDHVYLGQVSPRAAERGEGPAGAPPLEEPTNEFFDLLRGAFGKTQDMPLELQQRLTREGFVHMDAKGILATDRFITPKQIASVSGNRVTLRAKRGDLLKE